MDTPVMWSPIALNARLDAERALLALPRQNWGASADARRALRRVIVQVERRELSMGAAAQQLRLVTCGLTQYRRDQETRRGPRAWERL